MTSKALKTTKHDFFFLLNIFIDAAIKILLMKNQTISNCNANKTLNQ
jgi:hypothetical protein